ncbi:MAG: superoxide dismutase [Verrucomicrobia bacterium]|nr:superoxide dismutase [Verrucomicrobiota bacterium]
MITRREALKTTALTVGALALTPGLLKAQTDSSPPGGTYPFKVPDLGYGYDALEPYIDTFTMHLHHDKHHQAYVDNLNKALAQAGESFQKMTLENLLRNLNQLPENVRTTVRNNAGGHFNHTLFWKMLKKNEGSQPTGELASAITEAFGGYADFQQKFSDAAAKVFGSGWAWLVLDDDDLEITTSPNQDNPISKPDEKEIPLLGLDVWEHAYYLKYQNRRPEYIKAFWNVVDWDYVSQRYRDAMKG